MFPPCESAGKLYLEISKLLYALSVHDVLQQYDNITDTGTPTKKAESTSSATTTNTTTTTITCIHSTDSKSYTTLQLKQLLGQSILTALTAADPHTGLTHFPSNTSCTAGTQTEKGAEEKAETEAKREERGVTTAGSEVDEVSGVLREFREQCEEVALQLAMYAQADMLLLLLELAPSHPEDAGKCCIVLVKLIVVMKYWM